MTAAAGKAACGAQGLRSARRRRKGHLMSANGSMENSGTGRVCVLVLGMHRSGTSALARTVNLLGCDLPKTLVPEAPGNEAGHWESAPVCQLNDALLDSAGTNWRDFEAVNPDWFRSPKAAEFRVRAIEVLRAEFGASFLFVLKDPRMNRIAGWWAQTIEAAGAAPAILSIVRHPLEVAESLKKRDNFDVALGVLLWLRNTLDAEAQTRGRARAFVSYDGLLADWSGALTRAQGALGLAWPKRQSYVTPAIDQFLSDKLRHHRRAQMPGGEGANAWAAEAYAILMRWAAAGENAADHGALDAIRARLDEAGHAFARLVSLQWYHQGQAQRFEKTAAETAGKLADAEKKLQQAAADLDAARSKFAQTESALKQRSLESEEAARDLGEAKKKLAALEGALKQRSLESEKAARDLGEAEKKLAEMEAALREQAQGRLAADAQAANLKSELADRFSEIAALTRLVQERDAALADISRRLQMHDEAGALNGRLIAARASELVTFQSAVREIEKRLHDREEAFSKLDALFAERAAEADDLRRSAAAKTAQTIRAITQAPLGRFMRGRELKRRAAFLAATGLFDADWYRRRYEDVAAAGADPARHFIEFGAREGRAPSAEAERLLEQDRG